MVFSLEVMQMMMDLLRSDLVFADSTVPTVQYQSCPVCPMVSRDCPPLDSVTGGGESGIGYCTAKTGHNL
jgi:hypothetical protein